MVGESFYHSIVELTRDHILAVITVATAAHSPHVIVHSVKYIRHHGKRHAIVVHSHVCRFCSASKKAFLAFVEFYRNAPM